MNATDLCVAYAPVITLAIALGKHIPFVKNNAKKLGMALSIALNLIGAGLIHGVPPTVTQLLACILTSAAGGVYAHEVLLDKQNGAAAHFV